MPSPSSLAHLFVTDKGWPLHPRASAVIIACQNNSHLGREAQGGTSAPQTPEPQKLCPAEEGDNEKLRETQWVTAASLVGALEGEDAREEASSIQLCLPVAHISGVFLALPQTRLMKMHMPLTLQYPKN